MREIYYIKFKRPGFLTLKGILKKSGLTIHDLTLDGRRTYVLTDKELNTLTAPVNPNGSITHLYCKGSNVPTKILEAFKQEGFIIVTSKEKGYKRDTRTK